MHNVCDRIETELQQSLQRIVDNLEIDLARSCFLIGDTPDKAASIIWSPNKYR
jgi:hypothetical protein